MFRLGLCLISFTLSAADPVCPLPGYRYVWGDEFEGKQLDTTKWTYRTGTRLWSEQRPANVSVASGCLRLAGLKESASGLNYTAGGIISKRLFRFGYYESSFKVPPGAGWHTSFWLMRVADNSPGPRQEIDICENDSVKLTDYGINQHQWAPLPALTRGGKHVKTPDLSAALHLWGCEYTAERIQYYFDGNLVHSFDATQIQHGDVSVWLTMLAANLGGTKAVDDKALPAYAEFDYVRVYEPLVGAGERKPSADLKR